MRKLLITAALLSVTALNVNASGIRTTISYDDGTYEIPTFASLNFDYDSQSIVTDVDNSSSVGGIATALSDGDTITSVGGAALYNSGALTIDDFTVVKNRVIDGLNTPARVYATNTMMPNPQPDAFETGYGLNWQMSLALTGFTGTYDASVVTSGGTGAFVYDYGQITVYGLYDEIDDNDVGGTSNGSRYETLKELHTYTIMSHSFKTGGIAYTLEVTNVANDYFYDDLTGDSFAASLGNQIKIFGDILQTTGVPDVQFVIPGQPTTFGFGLTEHTGVIKYSVPEPTSIAILGLGLLGFAGASRRKAK